MIDASESERAVIHLIVLHPHRYPDIEGLLKASDFHDQSCSRMWAAIEHTHKTHGDFDELLVRPVEGVDRDFVTDMFRGPTAAISLLADHAERVLLASRQRALMNNLRSAASRLKADEDLAAIRLDLDRAWDETEEVGSLPKGLQRYDDYAVKGEDISLPWVIPGVLRRKGRLMVVAGEGAGKSSIGRQVAVCAAAGKHPFRLTDIEPRRVLVVDAENSPLTAIDEHGAVDGASPLGLMYTIKRMAPEWNRENLYCWETDLDGSFDLRSSRTQRLFEATLREHEPDLVVIGPIYKMYEEISGERDSAVASELQRVMDRLRLRHDAAWWIEHHAPLANGGSHREMRPYGTSLWQRWVDIGITLEETDTPNERKIGRFRKDRYSVGGIPDFLDRERTLPFVGRWLRNGAARAREDEAIA